MQKAPLTIIRCGGIPQVSALFISHLRFTEIGKRLEEEKNVLKVFLVEDEVVMRKGIKNNIPWEKEGFVFVGRPATGSWRIR